MKTKLLLLVALFSSTFGFSQIVWSNLNSFGIGSTNATVTCSFSGCSAGTNAILLVSTSNNLANPIINQSFANSPTPGSIQAPLTGLLPNTIYYWRFYGDGVSPCSPVTSFSQIQNFTTAAPPVVTVPSISDISSNPTQNRALITYTLNPNNGLTTSIIKYGLNSTDLSSQVNGFAASDIGSGAILTSALQPNTLYYYQIEATNSAGTSSSGILNFTTLMPPPQVAVAEYNFDNNLLNNSGSASFVNNANLSYTQDRFLVTNKALHMNSNGQTSAIISALPTSNNSRTISLWIRPTQVNSDNVIFTYGSGSYDSAYGGSFTPSNIYTFSYVSSVAYPTTTVANVWKHLVFTYDQDSQIAKIFVDGTLANSGSHPNWMTAESNTFYLGSLFGGTSPYEGDIDDLKIYNYALPLEDVASLFTNNTLASQNFNQNNLTVSLYPNPATDILNIELASEIKSVEVYSLQGQKVIITTQKQVNVSSLSKGIYLVKVTDAEDNSASQKLIVK